MDIVKGLLHNKSEEGIGLKYYKGHDDDVEMFTGTMKDIVNRPFAKKFSSLKETYNTFDYDMYME